jgi:hypothetical protein
MLLIPHPRFQLHSCISSESFDFFLEIVRIIKAFEKLHLHQFFTLKYLTLHKVMLFEPLDKFWTSKSLLFRLITPYQSGN